MDQLSDTGVMRVNVQLQAANDAALERMTRYLTRPRDANDFQPAVHAHELVVVEAQIEVLS